MLLEKSWNNIGPKIYSDKTLAPSSAVTEQPYSCLSGGDQEYSAEKHGSWRQQTWVWVPSVSASFSLHDLGTFTLLVHISVSASLT